MKSEILKRSHFVSMGYLLLILSINTPLSAYIPEEWDFHKLITDIEQIEQYKKAKNVSALIDRFRGESNELLKRIIIRTLGEIGSPQSIPFLTEFVNIPDHDLGPPVLKTLARISLVQVQTIQGSPEFRVNALLPLFQVTENLKRCPECHDFYVQQVVRVICREDFNAIPQHLLAQYRAGRFHRAGSYFFAFAQLKHEIQSLKQRKQIERLLDVLRQGLPPEAEAAERLLAAIGKPALRALLRELRDPENFRFTPLQLPRWTAQMPKLTEPPMWTRNVKQSQGSIFISRVNYTLGKIGDQEALADLQVLAKNQQDHYVKQSAEIAIKSITNPRYPYQYDYKYGDLKINLR